jgi:glycosyltransferase involved in cell wall biosynthesis
VSPTVPSSIARPRVSIVVPVYNGGGTLDLCLRAALASEHPAFEILVVDDGSTDDSARTAAELGCRLIRQSNQGPAAARNAGAAQARGELIVLLDADVVIQPDTLTRLEAALDSAPEVLACSAIYAPPTDDQPFGTRYLTLKQRAFQLALPALPDTAWTACFAVRREAYEACGGMDERLRLPAADDLVLGSRLAALGGRLAFGHGIEVHHHRPLDAWGVLRFHAVHAREWALATTRYPDLVPQVFGHSRRPVGNTLLAAAILATLPAVVTTPGQLVLATQLLLGLLWNMGFLLMLARYQGAAFALACFPLALADGMANALGLVLGKALALRPAIHDTNRTTGDEGLR